MEVIDLDLQGHFGHFDSEFKEFRPVRAITFNGFELESPNLHQICILGLSQLVLKMGGIDLDLQGHLAILTHKTAFNVALVHWSRPAKGCYTSQMCSCYPYAVKINWGNIDAQTWRPDEIEYNIFSSHVPIHYHHPKLIPVKHFFDTVAKWSFYLRFVCQIHDDILFINLFRTVLCMVYFILFHW